MQKNIIMNILLILFLLICTRHLTGEKINERISDGSEAPIDAYPWMVSIQLNFLNYVKRDCGGVIISDIFLLTAASCVQDMMVFISVYTIKAGIHTFGNRNETAGQFRSISQVIAHPNYTVNNYLNDLALIRVSLPFDVNTSSVSPITLSTLTSVENMDLITLGWGALNQVDHAVTMTALQQVTVQENVECTQNKSTDPTIQLCANGKEFFFYQKLPVISFCFRCLLRYGFISVILQIIFFSVQVIVVVH